MGLLFIIIVAAVFLIDRMLGRVLFRGITALARRLPYGMWVLAAACVLVVAYAYTKLFFIALTIAVGVGIYGYATGKLPGWYRQVAQKMGALPFVKIPLEEQSPSYKDYGTGLPR
jgi:hypothetical protein